MALDIINLYISILSSYFALSDTAATQATDKTSSDKDKLAPFVPTQTNSLTAGLYSNTILVEIMECVGEINAVDIEGSENSLKGLMESARWKFEEVICECWARGLYLHPSSSSSSY